MPTRSIHALRTVDFLIYDSDFLLCGLRLSLFLRQVSAVVISPLLGRRTFLRIMRNTFGARTFITRERAELYFTAHPGGPSAVYRPMLLPRSDEWVAILANDSRRSTVGLGATVEAALGAFDVQYLRGMRSPLYRELRRPRSSKAILNAVLKLSC
jgi:hypothetical protein